MRDLRKPTLFIFFLFCLIKLSGQTDFRPGCVITNENDTLHGLIDYRGDARNARRCDFRESMTAPVREFLPFSIQGYRFGDKGKYYVSKKVTTDKGEVELFMEFLVNGISDLYYYSDGFNFHYYLEKIDGQIFELTNEEKKFSVDGRDYIGDSKRYVGLLKYAFSDCPQLFPDINNSRMEDRSLINITRKYHDYVCDDQQCIIYEKQLPVVKVRFSPFVSMNNATLKLTDSPFPNMRFNNTFFPTYGIGINTSMPRVNEKIYFQCSGEMGKGYLYGSGHDDSNNNFSELHIHPTFLVGKVGFKYCYPKGKVRPTLMAGVNKKWVVQTEERRIVESRYGNTVYTTEWDDIDMPDNYLGWNIEAGVDFYGFGKFVTFVKCGFDSSKGNSLLDSAYDNAASLTLININTGIYF